jgi:hypothetical protein
MAAHSMPLVRRFVSALVRLGGFVMTLREEDRTFTGLDAAIAFLLFVIVSGTTLASALTMSQHGSVITAFWCNLMGGCGLVGLLFMTRIQSEKRTLRPAWLLAVRRIRMHRNWMIRSAFKPEAPPAAKQLLSWSLPLAACFAGQMVCLLASVMLTGRAYLVEHLIRILR